jgi:ADP-ribose pyrophosphatase
LAVPKRFQEHYVRRHVAHRGKAVHFVVDTVRLPNGKEATREYLDHPGAVGVLPVLPRGQVVLVEQYRYPVGRSTLEIPAGKLDPGESPMTCLKRELREETGYTAKRVRPLIKYWPTPAFSNELLHLYVAEQLTPGESNTDEDEFLRTVTMPHREALARALDGRIQDSKTVIALLAYEAQRHGRKS